MKIRADVDKKFIRRFLFISIGCFLFMLWGLYDGIYTSPMELERAERYVELFEQFKSGDLTESDRAQAWEALCNENNWPIGKPKDPDIAQNYVYFQWVVFGIGLLFGVFFLFKYLRLSNSWVEADETGIESSWGQSLNFDKVIQVNKRKWAKKGIAKVDFTDESGAAKSMTFDDFKYHRDTMGEILGMVEKNLKDEQIVGGERESAKKMEAVEKSEDGDPA